jgi:transcriptional regulator GlxA family with amidase domain
MFLAWTVREPVRNSTPAFLNTQPKDHNDVQSIKQKRRVCIVLFDEVEVLDFCGPFEVFSVTGGRQGLTPFEVYTASKDGERITARGGLSVNPAFSFENCPRPDILLMPGGMGTRREMNNPGMLDWLRRIAGGAELILSVCSGALVLAKAGLLNGLSATTHHCALDELRAIDQDITVDSEKRFIDNGRVIVSAGISSGIDMSLHVVARLMGKEQALETARYMEYEWSCKDSQVREVA